MADNYKVRDADNNPLIIKSKDTTGANGPQIPQSLPSDATGLPFSDTNPLPSVVQPRQVALIERSSGLNGSPNSLTTSSQQILAANTSRKGFWIQNLDPYNFMYVNFGSSANNGAGSIALAPYSMYETPVHMMPTVAIFASGSVAGQLYTCKEC